MSVRGAFTLRTAEDLLAKLENDLSLLKRDRANPYLAFNFFVTAEHMLDWIYPGYANKKKREAERDSEVLLQICSHLATGAKHFVAEAAHHNSVASSGTRGRWNPFGGPFSSPLLTPGGIPVLRVQLDGDAITTYGNSIEVLRLAELIYDYWKKHHAISNKSP
jgi:hypothetical protein